jgi:hypothetical protein
MSLIGKEKITRREFRKFLAKRNPILPGTYKKLFSAQERKLMEKRFFGRRPETQITKEKVQKLIREIGKEKYKVKDLEQKRLIDKKIRFLKKLGKP